MEVVLSPGRFGDETPAGVPFENEEIREWSHVDRLTGMLERARVETGRWRASNQGAARSYGKVIDSRERNSADGNIVQRARRQVEIFQSQGRGRSVQVVRASQWSSSRVTDSCTANTTLIPTLPDLDKKETEKLVDSSRFKVPEKLFSHQQDAMSERLSNLLGSLAISSTVPLRRIDSKYSSRAAIFKNSKRSNSNEDLSMNLEKNLAHRPRTIVTGAAANVPCSSMENNTGKNVFHDDENYRLEITANDDHERQPRATKSAIHLLPSSKSNTTVVNLMKDSRPKNIDNDTKTSDDKCWMVSWILPTVKSPTESIDDSSAPSGSAGKIPKRVGFSKTEIHFAADSGKVNIVETDEKPPPTNKFRRKRRGHLTGVTNKILPILDSSQTKIIDDEKIENSMENGGKTRSDVQQRVHTTTVNLGSEIMKKDERVNDESTTTMDDTSKRAADVDSSLPASNSTKSAGLATEEDYDIVCTDAENNQVLLKVVTTHEPTIARVENDHYRKLTKKSSNIVKSKNVEKTLRNELAKNDKSSNEHTYVNVFTGCETSDPIYENYKVIDSNYKSSTSNKREVQENCDPSKNEEKSLSEKSISRVDETKNPSNDISITRELENTILERIRTGSDEKSSANATDRSIAVNSGNKRGKMKMRKNNMPIADKKSTAGGELSSPNSINSAVNSRSRTCKISKNLATVRTLVEPLLNGQNSDSGFANKSNDKKISCPTKSSKSRQVPLARTRNKNESRQKPLEVVYQTAVYNMKNEKLSKRLKAGKQESRGPRYLNELICGAKTKRSSDCKSKSKTSSGSTENSNNNRGALQTVRHWK